MKKGLLAAALAVMLTLTACSGAFCSTWLTRLRSMVTFGSTISLQFPAFIQAL